MELRTARLNIGYNGHTVLKDINIGLPSGAFCVIIGPNGSGKSTFLKTISGVLAPIGGEIRIGERLLTQMKPKELARTLAMVFTDRAGGGAMTVRETVEVGRHPYTGLWGRLGTSDKEAVEAALEAVGMADKADRYLGTLSDGERQKTMIARALAQDTPVIVLDEPTAFLDVAGRVEIMRLLKELSHSGKTILLSTHDISPAMEVATHVMVVDPAESTIKAGSKAEMIASGEINLPFRARGMEYDAKVNDYR